MTTPSEISFELLHASVWPEIQRIRVHPVQQAFVPSPEKVKSQFIFDRKENDPPFEIYVIRLKQEVAGFFTLSKETDGYLWFGGFQLDAQYQNLGVGRKAIEKLFQFVANNPEYNGIRLSVQYGNKSTTRFYQRMGLSQVAMMSEAGDMLWLMKIDRDEIVNLCSNPM